MSMRTEDHKEWGKISVHVMIRWSSRNKYDKRAAYIILGEEQGLSGNRKGTSRSFIFIDMFHMDGKAMKTILLQTDLPLGK